MVTEAGYPSVAVPLELRALALRQERGDVRGIAYSLELLARVASIEGDADVALQLLSAAATIRDRLGEPARPMHRALNGATQRAAQERLGRAGGAAQLTAGRELTVDAAVELAQRVRSQAVLRT